MKNDLIRQLGMDIPIFGFSHCRDVVIAISRAGGLGVLGTSRFTAPELDVELKAIDEALEGRPYGVDMVFPAGDSNGSRESDEVRIPRAYRDFVERLRVELDIPSLETDEAAHRPPGVSNTINTKENSLALTDVAMQHRFTLLASALGQPPPEVSTAVHERGGLLAALAGNTRHAVRHADNGMDVVVAQGTEAGGHTGEISTFVLVPDVVDAVAPVPVLAAGGIGCGRQIAASMALGACGVWLGSLWLTATESDLDPIVKQKLIRADAGQTVRSRCISGKTVRQLRTAWTEAWERVDAPTPLPMPLQGLLVDECLISIGRHRVPGAMGTPVGQVVGRMNHMSSVAQMVMNLVTEYIETVEGTTIVGAPND